MSLKYMDQGLSHGNHWQTFTECVKKWMSEQISVRTMLVEGRGSERTVCAYLSPLSFNGLIAEEFWITRAGRFGNAISGWWWASQVWGHSCGKDSVETVQAQDAPLLSKPCKALYACNASAFVALAGASPSSGGQKPCLFPQPGQGWRSAGPPGPFLRSTTLS